MAHFRAHTSPLLLLQFDASGTLLVTASVHGHTVNIYHLAAPHKRGEMGNAVHLFRLCRGMTPAVIQSIAFSRSGQWLCVSSARVGNFSACIESPVIALSSSLSCVPHPCHTFLLETSLIQNLIASFSRTRWAKQHLFPRAQSRRWTPWPDTLLCYRVPLLNPYCQVFGSRNFELFLCCRARVICSSCASPTSPMSLRPT